MSYTSRDISALIEALRREAEIRTKEIVNAAVAKAQEEVKQKLTDLAARLIVQADATPQLDRPWKDIHFCLFVPPVEGENDNG